MARDRTQEQAGAAPPARPGTATRSALAIGLLAALAFGGLASLRLEAQGPYQDEMHQAAGAFAHLGVPAGSVSSLVVGEYPVLNMPYSAAIKTNLFGLYLRARGQFRLAEWRAFGILLGALALIALAAGVAPALPPLPLALLVTLVTTDASLVLMCRHDWGPVALALLLRALLVGLWLRGETCPRRQVLPYAAATGVVAGIAVFEKLSSAVLLGPLVLFLALGRRDLGLRRWAATAAGLAAGVTPLLAINLVALLTYRGLISLETFGAEVDRSLRALSAIALSYLRLGSGAGAADLVLGLPPSAAIETWEGRLAATSLVLATLVAGLAWRQAAQARWAIAALAGYFTVLSALLLMPRPTWAHHWILGTPLQYLGVALALSAGAVAPPSARARRGLAVALAVCCLAWIGVHGAAVWRVERALAAGRASRAFHPELGELGAFAARQAPHAVFVATDWGVALPIHCLANGRPGLVHESFTRYRDVSEIRAIQHESGKRVIYLVRTEPPTGVGGDRTRLIEADVAASPDWVALPLEPEARRWQSVWIRKYARRAVPDGGPPDP